MSNKQPGRSPVPPPGFPMCDRRHQLSEQEHIEEQLDADHQPACERCHEPTPLHMLTHAPDAWKPGLHFVCRTCKSDIRTELAYPYLSD